MLSKSMEAIEPQSVNRLWNSLSQALETVTTGRFSVLRNVNDFVGNFHRHVDTLT